MRVLTLTPFYPTASDDAAGCFIAEPLCELEKFGVTSCVVAVHPFHRNSAETNSISPVATWIRYPAMPGGIGLASAGAFLYASLISKVRKLHQSQRIDLIHAHAALPCGHTAVLLSRELKIPCVVTVHGLDAFFDNQNVVVRAFGDGEIGRRQIIRQRQQVEVILHRRDDAAGRNDGARERRPLVGSVILTAAPPAEIGFSHWSQTG